MGRIYACSGTHGTGKTDYALQRGFSLKRLCPEESVKVLHDLEVDCPYPINKEMSKESQSWLFANQVQQELFALSRFDIVVVDRTLVDVIAYTQAAGFLDLAAAMLAHAEELMDRYYTISIRKIRFSNYLHPDGIREVDDHELRQAVEDNLVELYKQLKPHTQGQVYGL